MSPRFLTGALLRAQSDERLAALAAAGHDGAFEAIVARYRPQLVRYCTRLVGPSRAEDAVQQALLNAHAAMSPDIDNLRAWLRRIAHNAAVNVLRSGRDETPIDERLASPQLLHDDLETRERLRRALEAVAALPEPQRDALMLQAIEGRSHEEIAGALALSPAAARQAVHRARSTLRAAVTAVTPYGLLTRGLPEATLGGSAAFSATKAGAALLTAGVIAGGAATIPATDPPRAKGEAAPVARAAAPRPLAAPAPREATVTRSATTTPAVATVEAPVSAPAAPERIVRRATVAPEREDHSGPGSGDDDREREDHSGPGSGDDDHVQEVESEDTPEIEAEHEDSSGPGSAEEQEKVELEDSPDLGDELEDDEDHSGPG